MHGIGEPPSSVVQLRGELDMEGAALLEEELAGLIDGPASSVLVDLSQLQFVDSSGLHCLVQATLHSRANGDKLRFMRGSGQVDQVMRMTRIDEQLPFAD